MRFSFCLAALFAVCSSAFASQVITLDPGKPSDEALATVSALVIGETTGMRCTLRLEPRGIVRGASACGLNAALKRSKFWRRSADAIFLYDARRARLLAFRAIGQDIFRAADVRPEALRLRLLPLSSMPMSQ